MSFHETASSQGHGRPGSSAPYDITFLYRFVEGGAGRSYGLNVAKMAGETQTGFRVPTSAAMVLGSPLTAVDRPEVTHSLPHRSLSPFTNCPPVLHVLTYPRYDMWTDFVSS